MVDYDVLDTEGHVGRCRDIAAGCCILRSAELAESYLVRRLTIRNRALTL